MDKERYMDMLRLPMGRLLERANNVREKGTGKEIELCGIVNAKSGACPENCKFCAQSAHHPTGVVEYPLKGKDAIIDSAMRAYRNGARRFGIVTSGNRLTADEIGSIAGAVAEIKKTAGIELCASLGALDDRAFSMLRSAGLTRYHHNIETSERFYPYIVSSHPFSERLNTIKAAKNAGLEVCSGGIIGMGETWEDRIEMALLLKELDVESVPINVLVPVKGTPLENIKSIPPMDAIRTIALFRIILVDKTIKVAAGRESALKDYNMLIYMAGANGMMIGGYLTVAGRPVEEDIELIEEVKRLWETG